MVSSRWFHSTVVFGKYEWLYLSVCVFQGCSSIYRCSKCSFRLDAVTGKCFCVSWNGCVVVVFVEWWRCTEQSLAPDPQPPCRRTLNVVGVVFLEVLWAHAFSRAPFWRLTWWNGSLLLWSTLYFLYAFQHVDFLLRVRVPMIAAYSRTGRTSLR